MSNVQQKWGLKKYKAANWFLSIAIAIRSKLLQTLFIRSFFCVRCVVCNVFSGYVQFHTILWQLSLFEFP